MSCYDLVYPVSRNRTSVFYGIIDTCRRGCSVLYGSTLHCPECRTPTPFLRIGFLLSPIRHYFPDCGRLNEPALGSAQQDSHLPRISRAAPIACICGWTGCLFRADGIIARQIAASAFGWVSIALHLKGRSLTSDDCPMQVVFAHPPHRCSPSSGGRQPTLFVAGYDCRRQCFSRCRQAVVFGLCSL